MFEAGHGGEGYRFSQIVAADEFTRKVEDIRAGKLPLDAQVFRSFVVEGSGRRYGLLRWKSEFEQYDGRLSAYWSLDQMLGQWLAVKGVVDDELAAVLHYLDLIGIRLVSSSLVVSDSKAWFESQMAKDKVPAAVFYMYYHYCLKHDAERLSGLQEKLMHDESFSLEGDENIGLIWSLREDWDKALQCFDPVAMYYRLGIVSDDSYGHVPSLLAKGDHAFSEYDAEGALFFYRQAAAQGSGDGLYGVLKLRRILPGVGKETWSDSMFLSLYDLAMKLGNAEARTAYWKLSREIDARVEAAGSFEASGDFVQAANMYSALVSQGFTVGYGGLARMSIMGRHNSTQSLFTRFDCGNALERQNASQELERLFKPALGCFLDKPTWSEGEQYALYGAACCLMLGVFESDRIAGMALHERLAGVGFSLSQEVVSRQAVKKHMAWVVELVDSAGRDVDRLIQRDIKQKDYTLYHRLLPLVEPLLIDSNRVIGYEEGCVLYLYARCIMDWAAPAEVLKRSDQATICRWLERAKDSGVEQAEDFLKAFTGHDCFVRKDYDSAIELLTTASFSGCLLAMKLLGQCCAVKRQGRESGRSLRVDVVKMANVYLQLYLASFPGDEEAIRALYALSPETARSYAKEGTAVFAYIESDIGQDYLWERGVPYDVPEAYRCFVRGDRIEGYYAGFQALWPDYLQLLSALPGRFVRQDKRTDTQKQISDVILGCAIRLFASQGADSRVPVAVKPDVVTVLCNQALYKGLSGEYVEELLGVLGNSEASGRFVKACGAKGDQVFRLVRGALSARQSVLRGQEQSLTSKGDIEMSERGGGGSWRS